MVAMMVAMMNHNYVEREQKLQPHLGIGCHALKKACFNTEVKIKPGNELTQYWNRDFRKEDTSALTYLDNTGIKYEPINGTSGDCQVQNHQKSYQTKPSSSKGNDQSKVREFMTFNTVVGSQSKAEVLFTTPTQYSSPVESTLGIRISEREADLCCVAVVKRTWSVHDYTITDITNPDISWTSYCFISSITCDFRANLSELFTVT